jgi:glycosyltransferase involved in cell wall biosynthesis
MHYPAYGGPPSQTIGVHGPLAARGIDVHVLLPDEPGNAAAKLRDGGVPVVTMPLGRVRKQRDPRLQLQFVRSVRPDIRRLRGAIRREGADVVLLTGLVNPHAAIAAHLEDVAVVWQVLDFLVPPPARQALMRIVDSYADATMFWGTTLRDAHVGRRVMKAPSFLATSPVDTDFLVPSAAKRAKFLAEAGIPQDATLVGMVGSVNALKGLEYFVEAAERIVRERDDTHFVIVGTPLPTHMDYVEGIRRRIAASPTIADRCHMLGFWPDVDSVYAALDVYMVSSISEALPTVATEAMSAGTPVVAANVGGVAETVVDGRTGYIVPPRDPEALADRALKLLGDPELRARMGAAGREWVIDRFSVQRSVDVHQAAFEAALAHRGARANGHNGNGHHHVNGNGRNGNGRH